MKKKKTNLEYNFDEIFKDLLNFVSNLLKFTLYFALKFD